MVLCYFLLFLISMKITNADSITKPETDFADSKKNCNITTLHEKKSRLLNRKKDLQKSIQVLWDKTNNGESNSSEPAKLKSFLNELEKIDRKLIRNERLLQKQLCRFL